MDWTALGSAAGGIAAGIGVAKMTGRGIGYYVRNAFRDHMEDATTKEYVRNLFRDHLKSAISDELNGRYPKAVEVNQRFAQIDEQLRSLPGKLALDPGFRQAVRHETANAIQRIRAHELEQELGP